MADVDVPAGLSGVTAIAAGTHHTVALKSDGTVVAWGYNGYGGCNVPVGLSGVTAIAAGGYHTVALKSDGTVVAWGRNVKANVMCPQVSRTSAAIAAGHLWTVALKSDGAVVAWGCNDQGQCDVPLGLSGVTAIAAGGYHTVALKKAPILWNKLGSEYEVTHSEIGTNGILAGAVDYLAAQDGNGFKPQPNPGYYDNPTNYVDFPNLRLSQRGSMEFWYWANWVHPYDGCRNIFEYGVEGKTYSMTIAYNDWQNLCGVAAWNQDQTEGIGIRFIPESTPQWTTARPMHFKLVWDGTSARAEDRLKFYIDGVQVGDYYFGDYTFDDWAPNSRLRLGSRLLAGQSWWHTWRGDDGIIDDLKVYDDSAAGAPRVENLSASLEEDSYENITLIGSDPEAMS